MQSVNDSILFEEFDYYKNLGLDVIMQPAPPELYNEMDSVFKYLEDELKISMDMDGDTFDFHLILFVLFLVHTIFVECYLIRMAMFTFYFVTLSTTPHLNRIVSTAYYI